MKHTLLMPAALLTIVLAAGCSSVPSQSRGKPIPTPTVTTVANVKPMKEQVTVRGKMIEKCPVAGCWFMLKDKTGVIKIDTKAAGFVVSDIPLNTEIVVSGVPSPTGEKRIVASGILY